jgi:hypothetical protein
LIHIRYGSYPKQTKYEKYEKKQCLFAATFLSFPQQTILNLLAHKRRFKNPLGDAWKSILTLTKQI